MYTYVTLDDSATIISLISRDFWSCGPIFVNAKDADLRVPETAHSGPGLVERPRDPGYARRGKGTGARVRPGQMLSIFKVT